MEWGLWMGIVDGYYGWALWLYGFGFGFGFGFGGASRNEFANSRAARSARERVREALARWVVVRLGFA